MWIASLNKRARSVDTSRTCQPKVICPTRTNTRIQASTANTPPSLSNLPTQLYSPARLPELYTSFATGCMWKLPCRRMPTKTFTPHTHTAQTAGEKNGGFQTAVFRHNPRHSSRAGVMFYRAKTWKTCNVTINEPSQLRNCSKISTLVAIHLHIWLESVLDGTVKRENVPWNGTTVFPLHT